MRLSHFSMHHTMNKNVKSRRDCPLITPYAIGGCAIRPEKQNPGVGSPMIKGNPYRVVLFVDSITPGWASRTGGY